MEPSSPTCDAPCPDCGSLNWFDPPNEWVLPGDDLSNLMDEWEAAGRPRRVVVDFSEVKFFDSGHLGRLIRLHQLLSQSGGRLRVEGLSDDIRRVFDLTKLTDMFETEE